MRFFMDSSKLQTDLFERWFMLIKNVNSKPGNLELLNEFFYTRLGINPEIIIPFLEYFKKNLCLLKPIALKKEIACKYLDFISSLCERFNAQGDGQALDNFCFKICDHEKYHEISQFLIKYKKRPQKYINKIISTIDQELGQKFDNFVVNGRYKNLYSIYKKINKIPHRNVLQIRDIFAFRVVLNNNSIGECFRVLKLLHGKYNWMPEFFKDYITFPKSNGYQSLHTTLRCLTPTLDLPVEIQIRTKSMDDFAQNGLCAHWLYSENKVSKLISYKEKRILRKEMLIFNYPTRLVRQIYCLDSNGNVHKLDYLDTILDFANKIHPEGWNKINSAYVNGRISPIDYQIQDGDKIEIMQDNFDQVTPDWLKFVYKKRSMNKILEYLAKSDNSRFITPKITYPRYS